tara:strand:- start:550 stop:1071 length:522 start_codon:yes stop_codon:yes gene_type:complete
VKALENYLNRFAKSVVNNAKGILKRKKKVVSGKLLNSISYKLKKDNDGLTVQFMMVDYGTFVDKGVSGTKQKRTYVDYKGKRKDTPYEFGKTRDGGLTRGLDNWIVRKGIAPRDAKGRFISRKSLKFLIARKIYTQGIQGISFFQKPLQLGMRDFYNQVGKAIKEDIENIITT